MSCDVTGCGCKICPGMWMAALLLAGMLVQNLFFRPVTKPTITPTNLEQPTQQTNDHTGISQ